MPCTIPIPVVMIFACEPIWTLECFCSCLKPCAHTIWARISPELAIFVKKWGQLGTKWYVWIKKPCMIPIPSFAELSHEWMLTLECFYGAYNHAYMWFGPNQPWNCLFLAKTGGMLGRKCCGWLKVTCAIPIPGFIINVCELILTLECFCSSLQSFIHVIWAKVALKLFVFGQIWGSAWH